MQSFRDASIRQKLTRIVLVASGVAVVVACTVFAVYDITTFRQSMGKDLTTVAEIVGANTTAALTFGDTQSAQETLHSLSVKPHIVEACILGSEGQLFATYSRHGTHPDFTTVGTLRAGVSIISGHMVIVQFIRLNGEPIGTIYLKSDLNELYARAARFAGIILVVLFASFLAAYLLASRLQRTISEPILELARTAFAVSTGGDYTVRAKKRSDDEVGFLFDRFNEMLNQIQQRDKELVWARDELETRVDERTKELQVEIVERKHAERNLEERTTFLNSLIEHAPLAIIALDAAHTVQMCNPAFETLFGYRGQEILGVPLIDLVAKGDQHASAEASQNALMAGKTTHYVCRRSRSDDSLVDVEGFAVPLTDGGKISGALVLYQDITERKRAEEALLRAKEAAEAASRAKSEFLANMSHEIRTPMNGIIGMTGLTLDTNLTTEQREYLGMVKTSADSLLTLINDILDFSKIEAGKMELDAVDFSLRQSLGETLKTLGFRAHEKGLELAWRVDEGVREFLSGDWQRLRQVILNLVGNAVKFTEQGEVVVGVEKESESGEGVMLHFSVKDTGIGIPPEKQKLVFEAFTQADGSTTRKYGGTGLGLAITTQIVQLMGGKIWLESELGRGSTFHFTARLGVPSSKGIVRRDLDPEILSDLLVLIVDDNKTNRIILAEMLVRWGMRVEEAEGAEAALATLERFQRNGRQFSLIISDLHMPGVDGCGFAGRLRTNPVFTQIPFLLLSSSSPQSQAMKCRELGIAASLMKPVQPSELFDAILNAVSVLPTEEKQDQPVALSSPERRTRMKVLLAEDNAVNRTLARKLLEKQGHTVVIAENGRQALEALHRESVDLVLMDVQMPEMDGLEATRAIRAKEKGTGAHQPIIALTAHAMKGDRERCLAAGADDYLTKPIHTPELHAALERIQGAEIAEAPSPAAPAPSTDSFDLATALQRVEGDRELLEEIVRIFVEECPKIIADIHHAFATSDARLLERLAHTLKGSASNLGALAVPRSAAELEQKARAGDFQGAEAQFKIVDANLKALLLELEAISGKVAH